MGWSMGLLSRFSADDEPESYDFAPGQPSLEDVLIAGMEHVYTFTATEPLSQREAVRISGDWEVSRCDDMSNFYGILPYDVGEGDAVPVIQAPALVKVRANDYIEPGTGASLQDSLTWCADDANRDMAIVHACDRDTLLVELELRPRGTIYPNGYNDE